MSSHFLVKQYKKAISKTSMAESQLNKKLQHEEHPQKENSKPLDLNIQQPDRCFPFSSKNQIKQKTTRLHLSDIPYRFPFYQRNKITLICTKKQKKGHMATTRNRGHEKI